MPRPRPLTLSRSRGRLPRRALSPPARHHPRKEPSLFALLLLRTQHRRHVHRRPGLRPGGRPHPPSNIRKTKGVPRTRSRTDGIGDTPGLARNMLDAALNGAGAGCASLAFSVY